MRYIVGVDVGGTNIVVGTVAQDGSEIVGVETVPTIADQGADAVVDRIVEAARRSMARAPGKEIAGVGIGSPGPLDTKTGVVLLTPNLGWHNMPLRDRVSEALGLPATLDNDANCAVFGEWWRGAARGATTSSVSRSGRESAAGSCSMGTSTMGRPTSPGRSDT